MNIRMVYPIFLHMNVELGIRSTLNRSNAAIKEWQTGKLEHAICNSSGKLTSVDSQRVRIANH